jgi:hypothetical protein
LYGLLKEADHAVDDIVSRCSYGKLNFPSEVGLPIPFRVLTIAEYL